MEQQNTIFERLGVTYSQAEDGLLYPNIVLIDPEPHYGKFGYPQTLRQDLSAGHPRHQRSLQAGHAGDDDERRTVPPVRHAESHRPKPCRPIRGDADSLRAGAGTVLGGGSMMDYLTRHPEKLWEALAQNVQLVLLTLVLSVALAAALTVWSLNRPRLSAALHGFLSVVYATKLDLANRSASYISQLETISRRATKTFEAAEKRVLCFTERHVWLTLAFCGSLIGHLIGCVQWIQTLF